MKTTRRLFLAGTAVAALSPFALAQDAAKPDIAQAEITKALNTPSAIGEMSLGPDTAKVTIVEYASASCPHCRDFYREVYVTLKKDYIDTGKIKFVFREFPHNPPAMAAFMLARCAPKEKFFPLIDVYFQTQEKWMENPLEGLKNIALQAGFTQDTFEACLKNEAIAKGIYDVRKQAEAIGVDSIPTIYINNEEFTGKRTIEAIKAKIDPLLG